MCYKMGPAMHYASINYTNLFSTYCGPFEVLAGWAVSTNNATKNNGCT